MQNHQDQEQFFNDEVEQEINLREYLYVILKRKSIILTILAVTFIITVIVTFSATPIYTSSSQVLIERNQGSAGLDRQYYSYDPDFLETQSAIIKSMMVARRVVENLKLTTTYRSYFLPQKKEKSSSTGIWASLKKLVGKTSVPPTDKGLDTSERSSSDVDAIASRILGGLAISPVKNTKIINITYSDRHPAMAKLIADAVVKAYMNEILDMKLSTSKYALQWMTAKADEEKKKLEKSEQALQKYMRDNDLVTVENKLAIYPQKLTEFSSQLSKAQSDRRALEDVIDQIKAAGSNIQQLENIPVIADNAVLKDLRESIFKARQNIKELSKKYGNKHPIMMKARDELAELLNQQQSEINRVLATTRNSYDLAKSQENNLQGLLDSTKKELLNMNEKFVQYSIMKRDVDSNRVVYDALTASIKKEGVTEQSQSINIWVVKNAALPGAPSKPNKRRNLVIGFILGLFGGIGCAFLIEYLDNTIKSEKDLETRFGLTVLGTIEELKEKEGNIESHILQQPLSPLAESYRLIRSGLLLSSAEHPPKVILVTSMGAREGKTTTTVNVARVLCQGKKKVLIVDCDLRRPRVHTLFSIENEKGLSSYLTGNINESIINKIPGEEIYVITSGPIPPNPAELVGSNKLKTLLGKMSENFDFILIDSPPIESVTDSLALTQVADGTLIVVRAGKTTYDMLQSGLKKLTDVRCHLLGSVLNGQVKSKSPGSYYSGYTTYYAKSDG